MVTDGRVLMVIWIYPAFIDDLIGRFVDAIGHCLVMARTSEKAELWTLRPI